MHMLVYFALGSATKISFNGVLKKHKKMKKKMHLMLQLIFPLTVQSRVHLRIDLKMHLRMRQAIYIRMQKKVYLRLYIRVHLVLHLSRTCGSTCVESNSSDVTSRIKISIQIMYD